MGENPGRHFLPVDLAAAVKNRAPQKCNQRFINPPALLHHLMRGFIRQKDTTAVIFLNIMQQLGFSGADAARNTNDFHFASYQSAPV